MAVISIEIISDVICPWCFIGYRTLQRSISLYKKTYPGGSEDEFVIEWKPYFIDQVAPETSVLINDRMARRMTRSQIEAAQTRLKRIGSTVGISFKFGGYIGSSRLAHRVLHLALERGGCQMQCTVADTLFQYQFEFEKDVSQMDVVVEAAGKAGMDGDLVREYLKGDAGKEEIETAERKVRERGVKGVPCLCIRAGGRVGEQVVDGAGEMEEIFEALSTSSIGKTNKNVKTCITMDSSSTVSCGFSSESLSLSRSRSQSFSESLSSIGPDSNAGTKLQLVERIIEPLDYYSTRRFHPVHLMDTFEGSRYRVIRKLGYGSFSTVWLARDTKLGRYVALKVGQAEDQSSSAPIEETRIYQLLAETKFPSHPGRDHYLPLLDQFRYTGPNGTHQALVYEPMSASVTEVKEALFPNGPFPCQMAKAILWQTLLGLDFLLTNGVAHGDIQPRNLLFALEDIKDVPEDQLVQDKDKSITLCVDTELKGGVKGPEYLVPAHSLMQYLNISKPFTIKVSDLGGSFLTSHPPSAPSPPLHLRGPETLFQRCISAKQDMWSFGCLIFEFITGVALFDLSDHPVTDITDDMHFIDMYNILGFPKDETLRNQQWPNWRRFFRSNGEPINHFIRRRDRDFDITGRPTSHTLEELLEEAVGERLSPEEMSMTKQLLRGLLEFDLEKRFTTKDTALCKTYDYIVVGGGTSGIPLAVRLAQSHSVAIIEAGTYYEISYPFAKTPGADILPVGSDPDTSCKADWGFVTTPQKGANGRRVHFARGKCLGGSPTREALDSWAEAVDDLSYAFDNIFPYYQRSVAFTPPDHVQRLANATALYNSSAFDPAGGPLQVSFADFVQPFSTWVARGMAAIGLHQTSAFNSGELNGYHYCTSTIRPQDQSRSTSESSFLPGLSTLNPKIHHKTMAKRILFDENKNAIGVEVNSFGISETLIASREVIVSAGVFQSPQLLMVSGIGPRQHLEHHNITVVSELPGVGQGMLDHPFFGPSYRVNVETLTRLANDPISQVKEYMRWLTQHEGVLTNPVAEFLAWEQIPDNLRAGFSEDTRRNLSLFADGWPEVEYMSGAGFLGNISNFYSNQPDDGYEYASILGVLIATTSRGTVTLASADTSDPPIINPNWLDTESDQQLAIAAFKRIRQAFASEEMRPVVIGEEYYPGPQVQSDEEILDWIRNNLMTLWHPSCTCKMGRADDRMAVVDSRARVFGVKRLRVVDASAFPFLPPGHPQSTCYMLAEKIADDILEQSGGTEETVRMNLRR
ncbi:uncharacterized protein BDW70DRAFT_168304 [Aspergillus foveolatus]|uniref:uncharacterized protein n=1 Tax=Aspergillus foveolatus TaxID=210207 RepID=UPI003CCE511A